MYIQTGEHMTQICQVMFRPFVYKQMCFDLVMQEKLKHRYSLSRQDLGPNAELGITVFCCRYLPKLLCHCFMECHWKTELCTALAGHAVLFFVGAYAAWVVLSCISVTFSDAGIWGLWNVMITNIMFPSASGPCIDCFHMILKFWFREIQW